VLAGKLMFHVPARRLVCAKITMPDKNNTDVIISFFITLILDYLV
jgi:hypothetical protein